MVVIRECEGRIIFCSGKQLIVFDEGIDKVITLPPKQTEISEVQDEAKIQETLNSNITCITVSKNYQLIAVSTENKQVVVFDKHFTVVKNFSVSRISSQMCFTPSNSLIVADRTGDVFLYRLDSEKKVVTRLLGHLSVILDVLVTECENYVITCDRDEKIRVSRFPNTYNIQSFCLGHTEFVIGLKVVDTKLISASGDGTIRFWNYLTGDQLAIINTNEHIDDDHVSQFCTGMNTEDVEVSALPITDMQIYSADGDIFIGVSLFHYNKLLLYSINAGSLQVNFCKHIQIGVSFSFSLSRELIVLTSSKIKFFDLQNRNYIENISKSITFSNAYNVLFETDQNISLLYKKRFDNVGEYIERKKARMEIK